MRQHLKRPRRPDDWRRHGYHIFEEITRIPWSLTGPGIPQGKIIPPQVRQIDMAPTLLELLGQSMPQRRHGRSVASLIRGESLPDIPAYLESGCDEPLRDWHGLRDGGWKYGEHPRWGKNVQRQAMLFDLAHDPEERNNVIEIYPEQAAKMRLEIDRLVNDRSEADIPKGQQISDEDKAKLDAQLRALGYI